jgi:hypothetical protein
MCVGVTETAVAACAAGLGAAASFCALATAQKPMRIKASRQKRDQGRAGAGGFNM